MNQPAIQPASQAGSPTRAVVSPSFGASGRIRRVHRGLVALFAVVLVLTGCETAYPPAAIPPTADATAPQVLHAGDVVKITFPRAPTMDTTQQIRRDGMINLYLVGEVHAADVTPAQFEKDLMDKYASQLVSREVRVTLVSSAFTIYVTGAVMRPGKITPDRDMTAFEAIMEAGGFDRSKANTKAVAIIRRDGTTTKTFRLDLQSVMQGKPVVPFYLKDNDVVYVPERISLF